VAISRPDNAWSAEPRESAIRPVNWNL